MYIVNIKTIDTKLMLENVDAVELEEILYNFRSNKVIFLKKKNLYLSSNYVISMEVISEEEQKKKKEKIQKQIEAFGKL